MARTLRPHACAVAAGTEDLTNGTNPAHIQVNNVQTLRWDCGAHPRGRDHLRYADALYTLFYRSGDYQAR
jgi:hypothetical protein